MKSNDLFYAMLYSGDWSGNEYREAMIEYLVNDTYYSYGDVVSYVNAIRSYDLDELSWVCLESELEGNSSIYEYVESRTNLSIMQIVMLVNSEERFQRELEDSYERVTYRFAA